MVTLFGAEKIRGESKDFQVPSWFDSIIKYMGLVDVLDIFSYALGNADDELI